MWTFKILLKAYKASKLKQCLRLRNQNSVDLYLIFPIVFQYVWLSGPAREENIWISKNSHAGKLLLPAHKSDTWKLFCFPPFSLTSQEPLSSGPFRGAGWRAGDGMVMSNAVHSWLTKYYLIHGGKSSLLHHRLCQIPPVQHPALQVCHQPVLMLPITSLVAAFIFLHWSSWMSAISLARCTCIMFWRTTQLPQPFSLSPNSTWAVSESSPPASTACLEK